jgi:hypothetical protein
MNTQIKLISLPKYNDGSPEIVQLFDKIRFEIGKNDDNSEYSEFCWFAREYPRCYRYHLNCAKYRLESIYDRYKKAYEYFEKMIQTSEEGSYGFSYASQDSMAIYWDFESFLSSINTALDILARIVGVAYKEQTPPSFNKICKKDLGGVIDTLKKAQSNWVLKMKDYRDCFVHYTPVDTLLGISANLINDEWSIRCKIPTNPNVREIIGFKYSKRIELLSYTIRTYKNMLSLDKAVAKAIKELYIKNEFPKRITNLFYLGKRN